MSEPTTFYILITPVLKANKVLGRIETFRLAQPLGPSLENSAKSVHREQCPRRDEKAENHHHPSVEASRLPLRHLRESLSVHLASRAHTHHPWTISLYHRYRFVSDLPLSTLVFPPTYIQTIIFSRVNHAFTTRKSARFSSWSTRIVLRRSTYVFEICKLLCRKVNLFLRLINSNDHPFAQSLLQLVNLFWIHEHRFLGIHVCFGNL